MRIGIMRSGYLEPRASDASAAEAPGSSEVVVLSVPGPAVYLARSRAGARESKPVIDTANGFGAYAEKIRAGRAAAQFNKARIPGSRCIKRFNAFTAAVRRRAGTRGGDRQWPSDASATKAMVVTSISDSGFIPCDSGAAAQLAVMERPGVPAPYMARSSASSTRTRRSTRYVAAGRTRRRRSTRPEKPVANRRG